MLIKTKNTKFKIHLPIYMVLSVFLVFFILLTNSVNVLAASDQVSRFPYVLSDNHSSNDYWSAYVEQTIINNQTIQNFVGNNDYIIFTDAVLTSSHAIRVRGLVNPSVYGNYNIDTFDYSSNTFNIQCSKYFTVKITFNSGGSLSFDYSTTNSSNWYGMFGSQGSGTESGFTYRLAYPVYVSNEVFTSGSPNFSPIILDHLGTGLDPDVFDPSDALEITDIIGNNFSNLPTVPSSPFDSSLSVVENIINAISWLAKIFASLFSNLLNNLVFLFNAIITALNNGFTFLSNNLQNFFKDFYDRLLDKIDDVISGIGDITDGLFSPFAHFFEMINSLYNLGLENNEFSLPKLISVLLVPSQEDLTNAFSGTPLYTLYIGVITAASNYYTTISGVLSSNYVYVFSLPTFTFGGKTFSGLQVSFDWYVPYKSYGDAIITVFLIIGYIRFLMTFIPNFFYGSGFIDHDVNNIHGRTDSL